MVPLISEPIISGFLSNTSTVPLTKDVSMSKRMLEVSPVDLLRLLLPMGRPSPPRINRTRRAAEDPRVMSPRVVRGSAVDCVIVGLGLGKAQGPVGKALMTHLCALMSRHSRVEYTEMSMLIINLSSAVHIITSCSRLRFSS